MGKHHNTALKKVLNKKILDLKKNWPHPDKHTNFGQAHEASEEPQDADAAVFAEREVPVGHSVLLVQDGEDVQHWQ